MAFVLTCTQQRWLCSKIGYLKFRFCTSTNPDKVTILYAQNKFQNIIHISYRKVLYWECTKIKIAMK